MKAQFVPDGLRIRADRSEFERLRAGEPIALDCAGPGRIEVRRCDRLAAVGVAGGVLPYIPAASLDELAARLPCRYGVEATTRLDGWTLHLAYESTSATSVRLGSVDARRETPNHCRPRGARRARGPGGPRPAPAERAT